MARLRAEISQKTYCNNYCCTGAGLPINIQSGSSQGACEYCIYLSKVESRGRLRTLSLVFSHGRRRTPVSVHGGSRQIDGDLAVGLSPASNSHRSAEISTNPVQAVVQSRLL